MKYLSLPTMICCLSLNIQLPVCAALPVKYLPVSIEALPGWQKEDVSQIIPALQKSCQKIIARARYRNPQTDPRATTQWLDFCKKALELSIHSNDSQVRHFLKTNLNAYQIESALKKSEEGLFTGYYEPTIPGSLAKTAQYKVPLYGLPKGYRKLKMDGKTITVWKVKGHYQPIPSRAEISEGPLLANTPVIAWVHSKVERFFLGIQGSGSVILADGKRILLGYAGQNGHKYYPIGRYLVATGALTKENISLQTIKNWLYQHPHAAEKVMNLNPSFIFFRKLSVENPIGAEGVPLTPGRSLAVDPKYHLYGALLWLSTFWPNVQKDKISPGPPLNRLMIAQDTGGAIKGPLRADIFFGSGPRAQWLAGHMQFSGEMWVLYPKGTGRPH